MKPVDFIVIGAGVLGTSHALMAARQGKKVVLLEKDNRPQSATVRNFGQVVPSGLSGRWHTYGRRSVEIYKEIQQEFDLSIRAQGSVYVASDEEEHQICEEAATLFKQKEYAVDHLSKRQTLDRFPFLRPDYVQSSLYFPDDLSVEPDRMIHRLLTYGVNKYGITYKPDTAVVACEPSGDLISIRTAQGEVILAERVLICNGSEFKLLFPDQFAQSGLIVSKLQMMQTRTLETVKMNANVLTGLTIRRYESFEECPSFSKLSVPEHYAELKKWGIHLLFKQATDGSIIIGDSHEYASATQTDDLGFDLNNYLNELMLAEAERIVNFPVRDLTRTWAGYYAQHPDELYEHEPAPRLHILTGIGGKGMTSSLGFAEVNCQKWFGNAVK
ncbi:TIGR03364 family FAD-dependent oxidoreductase [Arundinibacter roseus]|uniref:TIGR03364 family FAD-dependent oxidoreductase n=1 Tax=Arundinibacter roseus TaxID=2070510 RepID=A0A4R4KI88_9BACT|nr:TIGR03364 family FAD-dependent oxidoreductase [Arundinibacter roseus]TDB67854.1 TIGR03364 family FAD-dependent oxidoreductase [Arundinibacter roseus]